MPQLKSLGFESRAFDDLAWWIEPDRTQALRITRLIREVRILACRYHY